MYCKASGSARDWEKGSQDSTIIIVEEKADAWMLGEFGLVMRMTTGDGRPFVWSRGVPVVVLCGRLASDSRGR